MSTKLLGDRASATATRSEWVDSVAVVCFGLFTAVLIVLICFFVPRRPGMEEVGVFNAVYTYAHSGKMTFPIYGLDFFNSFGIHPPLHYAILARLLRTGLGLYSAEAVTIAAVSLLAIVLVLRGRFPLPVKLGFVTGIYGAIVLSVSYLPDHAVGVRPELHVSIAWFAGLVALESARLNGWHLLDLCFGSLLLAYAAAMQNYVLLAPAGLAVYGIWMLRTLPRPIARKKIFACCASAAVVILPFVLWYVIPNWTMMRANMNWGVTHSAPLGSKLAAYFDVYTVELVPSYRYDLFSSLFAIGPLLATIAAQIPVLVPTFGLLLSQRATRAMALAFLPVPLLALWTLPKSHYFISEQLIFLAAVWSALLSFCCWMWTRFLGHERSAVPVAAIACGLILLFGSPPLRQIHPSKGQPLHEMDLERAAARQIVGPHALVGSRHLAWFISGSSNWYRLEPSLTEPAALKHFDPNLFASQFDALADYSLFSWQTQNGNTLATMYRSQAIHLKGFYLSQRMRDLSLLFFRGTGSDHVVGFFLRNDQLMRFDQDDSGPVTFVTATGPRNHPSDVFHSLVYEPNILDIPGGPLAVAISAYIAPRDLYVSKKDVLPPEFEIIDAVFGKLSLVDARALVAASQASDQTIRFLKTPQERTLMSFLELPDHLIARSDSCTASSMETIVPDSPISSGHYAGFEPANVFDDKPSTWGSERLGPTTALVSFIGADFGSNRQVRVRAIELQHSPDPGSSISSAILMSSDTGYNWIPIALLPLNKDGAPHMYCVPDGGAHRFWKVVAADNPKNNYAWQVSRLRFYQ